MAIETNYNFKGIEVQGAYIRIDRLFGSKQEGWNSLVGVYTTEVVPAVPAVGVEGEEGYVPAQPETTRKNKITEFNHSAAYVADERGYITMYKSLQDKFGGVEV
jgi:hypothetical protein